MKTIAKFLLAVLSVAPVTVAAAPVSQTAGSNLTQYNGSMGSITGNEWNSATNPRGSGQQSNLKPQKSAKADFDNCLAVILRCAKPKCAGGGCLDATIAEPIVSGCLSSNSVCKKHAAEVTGPAVAQLQSEARAAKEKQEAAAAAAAAAAEQNSAAMQQQMQQMQQQMAEMQQQNSQQIASLTNALAESQQATADAVAAAAKSAADSVIQNSSTVVDAGTGLTEVQATAAKSGVSEEIISRATISGQVLSSMESVDKSLDNLKTVMQDAFRYAKCNEVNGDNCEGPKRVKKFRELAQKFFAPYDALENNLEDALYKAQSVGVDLGNIYMFFDGSCNRWAKYVCRGKWKETVDNEEKNNLPTYCTKAGGCDKGQKYNCECKNTTAGVEKDCKSLSSGETRGGHDCYNGQVIPPEDLKACTIAEFLDPADPSVEDNIINPDVSDDGTVRVGCASDFSKQLFRRRRSSGKGKSGIDIDLLQILISQSEGATKFTYDGEASEMCKSGKLVSNCYCGLGSQTLADELITRLQGVTVSKALKGADNNSGACCAQPGQCNIDCYDMDEEISYVAPEFALCDTHAWNAGYSNNDLDAKDDNSQYIENQDKLKQIIGLKTTIIAQQMYKQYSTLEKMIKQVKIMLEKEVLKADLQVASGTAGVGGKSSGDDDEGDSEFESCANQIDETEVMNCARRNLAKYEPYVEKGNAKKNVRKAMEKDSKALALWAYVGTNDNNKEAKSQVEGACAYNVTTSKSKMQSCYTHLLKAVSVLGKNIKKDSRDQQLLDKIYNGSGTGLL